MLELADAVTCQLRVLESASPSLKAGARTLYHTQLTCITPACALTALSRCALLYKDVADPDLTHGKSDHQQEKGWIQEKGWKQEKRDLFVRAQLFSNAVLGSRHTSLTDKPLTHHTQYAATVPSMLLHTVCDV